MLVHTTWKGEKHKEEEGREFENVHHHSAQWNLEWSQIRIDGENVDEFQVGEDVGRGKQAFGD